MSEFQFFNARAKKENTDGGMGREEMQNIARMFGIPNTDNITKDDKGNYYHGNELLNDQYLKDHKIDKTSESPTRKFY